jgi:hypothetical protein
MSARRLHFRGILRTRGEEHVSPGRGVRLSSKVIHSVRRVTGGMLWAIMHLLFWLSVVPFVTKWMGESHFASIPPRRVVTPFRDWHRRRGLRE